MSLLRARCPRCRTLTAVAVDEGYECHACGRSYAAGLVRVPRAWGDGGEPMVEAAALPLDYPEVAVVEEETLAMQTLAVASDLPVRPLVLGGCCCAHVGAVEGLSARHGRVGVLWLDAHGDLNTPETSPSGNEWGMPLRTLLDRGTVDAADVVLWGARNLDPPEEEFIAAAGIGGEPGALLERADAVYVALDCDVVDRGRAGGLHARAGRADARRARAASGGGARERQARRRGLHRPRPRPGERREGRAPRRGARLLSGFAT